MRALAFALLALSIVASFGLVHAPSRAGLPGATSFAATPAASNAVVGLPHLEVHPAVAGPALKVSAITPTMIGLNWTVDESINFTDYEIDYSSTGATGPWVDIIDNVWYSENSTFIINAKPGTTYWWRELDWWSGINPNSTSQVVSVTQPSVAVLSIAATSDTSASFGWTNPSNYGWNFSLTDYIVTKFFGATYLGEACLISVESTTNCTVSGLTPSTTYTFQLATVDLAHNTSDFQNQTSYSNAVTFAAPSNLTATAAGPSTSVDVGQSAAFTCSASGGAAPVAYSWTFSDGAVGAGTPVLHDFSSPGNYTATCAVHDAYGSNVTAHASAQVVAFSVDGTESASIAVVGASLTFTASASGGTGGPYTYAWTFGDGSTGTGASATHAYQSAGDYPVAVTAHDAAGGAATKTLSIVRIDATLSVAIFTSDSSTVPGTALTLTPSITGGSGNYTCSWTFGDGSTAIPCTAVSHAWNTAGTYRANLTVTDPVAGKKVATLTVVVAATTTPAPSLGRGLGTTVGGLPVGIWIVLIALILASYPAARLLRRGRSEGPPPPGMGGAP